MQTLRYAPGYQPRSGLRPGSLSLTLLVGGGLVAAMFFVSPHFVAVPETRLTTSNIPIDIPPPPQPQPKPQPKVLPHEDKLFVAPLQEPLMRPDPQPKLDVTVTPPPPTNYGEEGAGTIPAKIEPAKPPMLVGAAIDPRFAARFQPAYPSDEIRMGREGRVTVRILIGTDGRVKAIEKVSAASDSFFAATRTRALAEWRFTPATRDGVPYETWKTLSVSFVLDQQ